MVNNAGHSGTRRSFNCLNAALRSHQGKACNVVPRNRKTEWSPWVGVATSVQQKGNSEESGYLSAAGLSVLVQG